MTKKTVWESWIAQDIEAEWCSGCAVASLDKMHIVPTWDIPIPAKRKEVVWGQDRDAPVTTIIGPKEPVNINITTRNVWSFRPLYLLLGGGSYTAVGSSGIITQDSGTVLSFAIQEYRNGDDRAISGCVMDEVSLIVPRDGGNLQWEWRAIGADYGGTAAGTNPGTLSGSLRGEDGTYTLESGSNTAIDDFLGGRLTFRNNLIGTSYRDAPDVANGRILKPALGNLEVIAELDYRIHTVNTFSQPYEDALTGVFDLNWTIKDTNNTGCVISMTGMQIPDGGYSEPVPTSQDGVIELTIRLIQSEDFSLDTIQVTGVDFS